jgi:arylformamidase
MSKSGWIDVTVPIINGMVNWPGDKPVHITQTSQITNGDEVNITHLNLTAHTGTHMDAPLHYIQDGNAVSDLGPDDFMGEVKVFHITDPRQITFGELKELNISAGDRVFFRTRNSDMDWSMQPFMDDFVGMSINGAQYLAKIGVRCIGVDYISIASEENSTDVHGPILGANILIIEGLNLREILPGIYDMIALPLKIDGADGAPARVLLKKQGTEIEKEIPN